MTNIKFDNYQNFWSKWRHIGPNLGNFLNWEIFTLLAWKIATRGNSVSRQRWQISNLMIIKNFGQNNVILNQIWANFLNWEIFTPLAWKVATRGNLMSWQRWQISSLIIIKNFGQNDSILDQILGKFSKLRSIHPLSLKNCNKA